MPVFRCPVEKMRRDGYGSSFRECEDVGWDEADHGAWRVRPVWVGEPGVVGQGDEAPVHGDGDGVCEFRADYDQQDEDRRASEVSVD